VTDEKNPQAAKIKHGLPPKHNPVCYQTLQDIVIPAGTMLRNIGDDEFAAGVGFDGIAGQFMVTIVAGVSVPSTALKRVIAA
jgi:hypothetical protein